MTKLRFIGILIFLPLTVAVAAPDVEVQKSVSNAFPMANEPVKFTVAINNIGDEAAADLVIVDALPAELSIPDGAGAFPSNGSYDPATGEWDVGLLDSGASAVLVVPAIVTDTEPPPCIVNYASSAHAEDLNDVNDQSRAAIHQTGVERCVDLEVEFGISAGPPFLIFPSCDLQGQYNGNVEVTNHGPDAARNIVVIVEQAPVVGPNLRFNDVDCDNASAALCNIGEIAVGETITIDVTSDLYQSYTAFQQTLTVSATTSDADYDPSTDSRSSDGTAGGFSSCEELDFGIPATVSPNACFIATAAYGSPFDSRIDSLRRFRDRFMLNNRLGRALVHSYYRYSPPLADFIAGRDWLRAIVRAFLTPIVFAIDYPGRAILLLLGIVAAIRTRFVLYS